MRSSWVRLAGVAIATALYSCPAWAQTANPAQQPAPAQPQARPAQAQAQPAAPAQPGTAARQIQGQIIRTAPDQFVVRTRDNKEVVVYTNPQTRYLLNSRPVQFSDLRVGANINAGYVLEGNRYIASNVVRSNQPFIRSASKAMRRSLSNTRKNS